MREIKWLNHTDKDSNKIVSIYYSENKQNYKNIKYEIKFQYSMEDSNKIECYIVVTAEGNNLPHRSVYENYFESRYYKSDKLRRVFFNLDDAKKYTEKLIENEN